MASPRSLSATILSKMRRWASRKKSRESISYAAWLNASLGTRIAPSTDFSASRLCGSVRSGAAVSGLGGMMNCKRKAGGRKACSGHPPLEEYSMLAPQALALDLVGNDLHPHLRGDAALELDRP